MQKVTHTWPSVYAVLFYTISKLRGALRQVLYIFANQYLHDSFYTILRSTLWPCKRRAMSFRTTTTGIWVATRVQATTSACHQKGSPTWDDASGDAWEHVSLRTDEFIRDLAPAVLLSSTSSPAISARSIE